jgi:serine phosphatase RsbU (regulator of sigma subunit)/anti-anti-sigma regulatory factor
MADLRVLVVDDEELILQLLKSFFRRRQDHCDVATNGMEALRLVDDRPYDLVLSDISMPGMDGLELIDRVKKLQPHAVCILMSGMGTRRDVLAALKIGVFDFIDKPVPDLAALTMVIDRAAESGRVVRERDALLENLREQNAKLEYSLLRLHEAFGQLHQQEEALESDLQKAQRVQRTFLPTGFPRTPGFEFFGYYAPCDQLGGDFFGTLPLADGRTGLYLVDVAGHGVSAAMITVTFRELMRGGRLAARNDALFSDPAAVLSYMNEALLEEKFEPPIYVAMLYGVIDPRTGEVSVASAGHPAPILVSNAQSSAVDAEGTVLGTTATVNYTATTLKLNPGDALLFYSDGLSESRSEDGREFSAERLQEIMARQHTHSAPAIGQELEQQLLGHLQGAASTDDVTFLVVTRTARVESGDGIEVSGQGVDSVKFVLPEKSPRVRTDGRAHIRAGFHEERCVVQLSGITTWQLAPALRDTLRRARDRAELPFHIDLVACEAMDSTILGLLLQESGSLVLHQPSQRVLGQLHEMGVLRFFEIDYEPCPQPQVAMDVTPNEARQACSDLILSAHEALMDVSESNRQKFRDVVESLRGQNDAAAPAAPP